jgi:phage anti-repressor protein
VRHRLVKKVIDAYKQIENNDWWCTRQIYNL